MRQEFVNVAKNLKQGREQALSGNTQNALQEFDAAIATLRLLPPERTRDVLMAHVLLNRYQTLTPPDKQPNSEALQTLQQGVSYARSTRDPVARALAEECMSKLTTTNQT